MGQSERTRADYPSDERGVAGTTSISPSSRATFRTLRNVAISMLRVEVERSERLRAQRLHEELPITRRQLTNIPRTKVTDQAPVVIIQEERVVRM